MDVATATPAQVDTEIARLNSEIQHNQAQAQVALTTIERIDEVQGTYEANYPWNSQEKRDEAEALIGKISVLNSALFAQRQPLINRYNEERWTRYFLVVNSNGHVHSSTSCDTCFITTEYAWLTEHSGMTPEALVEEAGEQACTVCFPWAPVDVLQRESRLETPERKARREEKERLAAEKAAKAVVVEGYTNYAGRARQHTFKSVRAATNAIAHDLGRLVAYGTDHPSSEEWLNNVAAIRRALKDKGVEYDYDKALNAARKKSYGPPKY